MRQVAAVVSFLALALVLVPHAVLGQSQSSTVPPTSIGAPGTDEQSPPGCLAIAGKPLPRTCEPCPPLWFGGPTVRCITHLRFKEESGGKPGVARNSRDASWLRACPGVPTLPIESPSARLGAWICGSGFITHR